MLKIEDIDVRLGDFRLNKISLHVKPGTYMALLGPTGTGKTVLLETIAGVYQPHSGRVFINGKDVTSVAPEKRNLGIVYQDYALFPHLTVFHNIAFGLRMRGMVKPQIEAAVSEMAGFLEIAHLLNRHPRRLSGGERQRVALARALVMKPHALLLDEPLSALDRATRNRIQNELKRIHAELGVTIIHITHNLSEAFFLADRLAVMKNGRILQEGPPDEVCTRVKDRCVAELVGIENLIAATVEDKQLMTPLGAMDLGNFPTGRDKLPDKICLTLPGWAVELFPAGKPQDYIWRGDLRVSFVNQTSSNGIIEVALVHEGGETLKTYLSRREARSCPALLEAGALMPIGLLGKGIHWVPDATAENRD